MVVSDLIFPHFSGGARRTLETARILSNAGYSIVIFANKTPEQACYEKYENFVIYRQELRETGQLLRKLIATLPIKPRILIQKLIGTGAKSGNQTKNQPGTQTSSNFESHLEIKETFSIQDKIRDFYRHKLPVHKLMKILPALPLIFKIIKREKIDVIYERGESYGLGILAAKLMGRVSIVDFIDIMYWDWALKHTDRILAYLTRRGIPSSIPKDKIDMVYTCVDEKRFNPNIAVDDIKKKYNLTKDTFTGIYVGAFYLWHGLEYIIEAVKIINNNPKMLPSGKKLKILMVGKGEQYHNIKKLIKKDRLEDQIILTGQVNFDEVPKYINAADFCISANVSDSLGLKTFEYLACAKPLINTTDYLIRHYLKDGVYALLINSRDPKELAEKISYLGFHPDEARRIGMNARKLVEQKLTWAKHRDNILKSYKKAMQTRLNR
jgi:glycosyltransferase involved in cell wall biosynthesis